MPLHHAVLALLADRPAHGYELKSSFEEAVGEQWGGLNIGHLYQILDRLARDGLIESERQPQPVKPDRVVHHLTPAGRAELGRWLGEASMRARGFRDDFFLKVVAAVQSGDPAMLAGVLSRQRAHLLHELRSLSGARALTEGSAVTSLLVTAELHTRADLGVVDAAEESLGAEAFAALQIRAEPDGAARTSTPARRLRGVLWPEMRLVVAPLLLELHGRRPFILAPGVYDGLTAKIAGSIGFDALYMTGFGTAASLGMPDVGLATLTEMAANVARVVEASGLPVIADADTGYGNPLNVQRTAARAIDR